MASLDSRSPAFKSAADYMTSAPEASKTSNDVKLEVGSRALTSTAAELSYWYSSYMACISTLPSRTSPLQRAHLSLI